MKSCETVARKFSTLCKSVPGILSVQHDEDGIVVFIDRKVFKENLPNEFEGFKITPYDVRYMLKASNEVVEYIKKNNPDLSIPDNRKILRSFVKTNELCNKFLNK
jgi:hypothetical protein